MQNVEAFHPFETSKHICCDVTKWVTDVKTSARGVREHIKYEQFGPPRDFVGFCKRACRIRCFKSAMGAPILLPFGLDFTGE